jgi:hypothetical protein
MPKYAFSQGRITVEEGVYLPILRDDKPKRRGVMILANRAHQPEPNESSARQEQTYVKQ